MKKKYSWPLICLLLLVHTLGAQSSEPAFHLDKPFYVTGDALRYQLYLPAGYVGHEIALKIVLVDDTGTPVQGFYQQTKGEGELQGFLKLPYDLQSAVYHLLVLGTDRSSLQKVKLAEILVPVYNDLEEETLRMNEDAKRTVTGTGNEALRVSIDLASGPFRKREEIRARVKVTDETGRPRAARLSVSVIDAALFGSTEAGGLRLPIDGQSPEPAQLSDQHYLNGRISGAEGRPRASTKFGAYLHDLNTCLVDTTDESGKFALPLPEFTGTASIQFVDLRTDSLSVVLDDGIELAPTPALPFNEQLAQYLKWSRSRKVIYQLYNTLETNLEQRLPSREEKKMEPDQRIILSEYPDFKNLATFFTEVGTPLKFRLEKDGGYTAMMFNPDPRMRVFYPGIPIFMVDGKMTRNVDFVQQIALNKIDTIDLYFDFFKLNEYFDRIGGSGIVVLKTSIPNLDIPAGEEADIFSVNGLLPDAAEISPDMEAANRPVFRSNLFWAPGLNCGNDGQAQFNFLQSDDLGTFLIRVVARTPDGRLGTATQTYEVQW